MNKATKLPAGAISIAVIAILLNACGGGGGSDTPNVAPIAHAGDEQSYRTGSLILLDGRDSSDANFDPLTYLWTITSKPSGSSAALEEATSSTPQFTADLSGTYQFELVVNDGKLSSTADVVTITTNATPSVDRSYFYTRDLLMGDSVNLDVSNSSDPEGDTLQFLWSINQAPTSSSAQVINAANSVATFTPDIEGHYEIKLSVDDGFSPSLTSYYVASVNVTTTDREGPKTGIKTLSATSIDSTLGDTTLTMTIPIADATGIDTSDFQYAYAKLSGAPNTTQIDSWQQLSGDGKQGIFEFSVVIPLNSQPGRWVFSAGFLTDTLGNTGNEAFSYFTVE